jgi:hypothetical protein
VLAYGKYAPRDSPSGSLGFDRNTPTFSLAYREERRREETGGDGRRREETGGEKEKVLE